ncbi:unnamed protein product [Cochlearia groenlandica]
MARPSGHLSYTLATVPMAIFMTVLCLFIAKDVTHARRPTTYTVGDEFGWTVIIPMDSWATGKTFYAGDVLVFKYDAGDANLMVVNRTGYETCIPNKGAIEYTLGEDKITLPYGLSYYIGTYFAPDCSAGMKLAIRALAPKQNI